MKKGYWSNLAVKNIMNKNQNANEMFIRTPIKFTKRYIILSLNIGKLYLQLVQRSC